jgi:sugar lactone lactonase YvrE
MTITSPIRTTLALGATTALALIALAGCGGARVDLHKPTLLFERPTDCRSPDGMCIGKDGNIYLSMNNADGAWKYPSSGRIMRITADDKLEEFSPLVADPETKTACPLGIGFGSDGNLYVSDAQNFATQKPLASRIQRVVIENGKPVRAEVIATNLGMANGLVCRGEYLYINDSCIDGSVSPIVSGVYRIKLSEFNPAKPLKLTGVGDPRLILTLKTKHPDHKVGANGLDLDADGNLYVCNFGDREVWKATFTPNGTVKNFSVLAKDSGMESCDGLHVDQDGGVWVADFLGNAIFRIDSKSGTVTLIAKNGHENLNELAGDLLAPSECIRRGDKVYVSNIDLTYGPNKKHKHQTMSVIQLKK